MDRADCKAISSSPPDFRYLVPSTAPARASAGVALHAGAVAHQRVVPAFAAGIALVALHFGLGAGVECEWSRRGRVAPRRHRFGPASARRLRRSGACRPCPMPPCSTTRSCGTRFAQVAGRADLLQNLQRFRGSLSDTSSKLRLPSSSPRPRSSKAGPFGLHMRQIGAVEVADRQFAEDVVEDRGGVLDRCRCPAPFPPVRTW